MKILLVHPENPDTYWSFKHALKFVSKKAVNPPLGLITVASLLPAHWEKKLIDMNVSLLKEHDIKQADYVFISAMSVQLQSVQEIIKRCKSAGKKIVAGGPLFTEEFDKFSDVDYLVLNEAEITLPVFIKDLLNGGAKHIYRTSDFTDLQSSPIPDYSLIKTKKYNSLTLQFTRGCPFNCEFCDIIALYGHKVRTKSTEQVLSELENLYNTGWRNNVFFVDDNFIGNKAKLKESLLPAMIEWMRGHNYPFTFMTEASINLADDPVLLDLMVQAGFDQLFIGIETTEEASLIECNKVQNHKRDLMQSVKIIQSAGIEVTAGFIVGFDNDSPSVFQHMIEFIQRSGIITAMVGLLNAPRKTKLYERLEKEGRIIDDWTGDNTNFSMNFVPKMNKQILMKGYQNILHGIYSSRPYYERITSFLKTFDPSLRNQGKISFRGLKAFFKSVVIIGILKKNRRYYWKLLFWTLIHRPETFSMAVTYSIFGYHYRKVFNVRS
jgi:radical SAM superfamily enzyme YgiQ (UPF0313 family)